MGEAGYDPRQGGFYGGWNHQHRQRPVFKGKIARTPELDLEASRVSMDFVRRSSLGGPIISIQNHVKLFQNLWASGLWVGLQIDKSVKSRQPFMGSRPGVWALIARLCEDAIIPT